MSKLFPDPLAKAQLSDSEIDSSLDLLMREEIGEEPKGAFLTALHRRGETAAELAGFARAILDRGTKVALERDPGSPLLELCGTGGDRAGFINISTAAMFVAAGAGARVVKHGNRGVSSRCGSADVLEALGITLHINPSSVASVLESAGCVFLLASDFHPMIGTLSPLRRSLAAKGQMTIFNLLGPLLNPALPEAQLTGIFNPAQLLFYAEALSMLGRHAAWAVHGEGLQSDGGVDELSITGPSRVVAFHKQNDEGPTLREFVINPQELGFSTIESPELLLGGDARSNALRIQSILSGQEIGPARDMIVLNAGAALHLAGIGRSLPESLLLAVESIASGEASRVLDRLRNSSKSHAAC
ncbi:MAG: anthranilate phosphoribosyltransferase [Verrucomicrobia bacterium]|nr:anthranilate phosphoribosyltransferase [Verrucomicrobiota bacterium]